MKSWSPGPIVILGQMTKVVTHSSLIILRTLTSPLVLTWISIYFLSKAGPAASVRIYYEFMRTLSQNDGRPTIPYGISYFPKEIAARPKMCVALEFVFSQNIFVDLLR